MFKFLKRFGDALIASSAEQNADALKAIKEQEKVDGRFYEHYRYLRAAGAEARKSLDKSTLAISSALLAASLTFIQFQN
jgi:hypothetical protein